MDLHAFTRSFTHPPSPPATDKGAKQVREMAGAGGPLPLAFSGSLLTPHCPRPLAPDRPVVPGNKRPSSPSPLTFYSCFLPHPTPPYISGDGPGTRASQEWVNDFRLLPLGWGEGAEARLGQSGTPGVHRPACGQVGLDAFESAGGQL